MRRPFLMLVVLFVLTGCPRVPGLSPVPDLTLKGQIEWPARPEVQALASEVSNGATVSLIDPATGTTLSTALTQPDGSFSLAIKGIPFQNDRPYLLEALKGLSAGGAPNRAGASGARVRTLVSRSGNAWTSLTGPAVRLDPSSTALCIVSSFRNLDLTRQQALMGKLPPATIAYEATTDLPSGDFTAVEALVSASLILDQDPVHVIARNTLNGTYVRLARGPFITNLSTMRGLPGSTVTLYGTGLDPVVSNNLVSFNGTPASSMSLVPGGIAVSVPTGATVGPLTLRVGNLETVVAPSFSPALAMTTLETIAGTLVPPAGTLATAWGLYPGENAADEAGNCYVADGQTTQIFKVAASGQISLFAGKGGRGFAGDGQAATGALFGSIDDLAVDRNGNLFVADLANYRVRRIDAATGVISTVAGNGSRGTPAEGAVAVSAPLYAPEALTCDQSGNLYIADNGRIRRLGTDGLITTVAGGGAGTGEGIAATSADLSSLRDIGADAAGNLYIGEYSTQRLRKVSGGIITTILSGYTITQLAVDGPGNVYISSGTVVRMVPTTGPAVVFAGTVGQSGYAGDGNTATSARLGIALYGLSCTRTGTVFISDANSWRVRKVAGGIITTVAGRGDRFSGEGGPALQAQVAGNAGAYDAVGNLYLLDSYRIRRISPAGVITTIAGTGVAGPSGDGGLAINAQLGTTSDLVVDSTGTLFFADGNTIRRIGTDGVISRYAGGGSTPGENVPALSAQIAPNGLALDPAQNLYFTEYTNHRVKRIDRTTGLITTVAGGGSVLGDNGPATSAQVFNPTDIAFDAAGNMYITGYNYRVRKVDLMGTITTIAGNGSSVNYGDGIPATSARLDYSSGIAVDRANNVFVTTGAVVRMVDTGGIIRTMAGSFNGSGLEGDGSPARNYRLWSGGRLWLDPAGQLVIADQYWIRRLY